jgi:exoribonuclease R
MSGRSASIAEHISVTERVAAEAESDSVKMKKLEFFQRQIDAKDPQLFRASVLDVKNFGLVVELPDVLLTGLIHISSLTDDFYVLNAGQRQLIGRQSRRRFLSVTSCAFTLRASIFSSGRSTLRSPKRHQRNGRVTGSAVASNDPAASS